MSSQFDELAQLYENMADWPFRKYMEIPTVLETLGDLTDLDVLDFGCGTGMYCRWLKDRGAARVAGFDIAEGMIEYARAREEREGRGLEFSSGSLPASYTRSFDIVLSVYVLPYATTYEELVDQCRTAARALKPGGRYVTLPLHPDFVNQRSYYERYGLSMVSPHTPPAEGDPVDLRLFHGDWKAQVTAHHWSRKALETALAEAGFDRVAWLRHQVTEDGLAEHGTAFWEPYLAAPHAAILDCHKETDR